MNKSSRHSIRRHLDALERRDVPAIWNIPPGPLPPLEPAPEYASITFENGLLKVVGTSMDDIIQVDLDIPVLTPALTPLTFAGGNLPNWPISVTVMDAAGTVRTGADGAPLVRTFAADSVGYIEASGLGGSDRIVNGTAKNSRLEGGEGNDTLAGGAGADVLYGEGGHDSLSGRAGDDSVIDGGSGNDWLDGGAGNDMMFGKDDHDSLLGGGGNDTLDGGDGNDLLAGGIGNDTLGGGNDDDILSGEGGNDRLSGEAGIDFLSGGQDNDDLYGGSGNDDLEGGSGNDGLFGGAGRDSLTGGLGIDRFLKWGAPGNTTTIVDVRPNESETTFKNTPDFFGLAAAAWTDSEIETVDAGLRFLHDQTGNTRMLKLVYGKNLTLVRSGADPEDAAATNFGGGRIVFYRGALSPGLGGLDQVTVHELAHNWDTENGRYGAWKALSGWQPRFVQGGLGFIDLATVLPAAEWAVSLDGKWMYRLGTEFARDYGKTNPREDFATMFEVFFQRETGRLSSVQQQRLTVLQPKLDFISNVVERLKQ